MITVSLGKQRTDRCSTGSWRRSSSGRWPWGWLRQRRKETGAVRATQRQWRDRWEPPAASSATAWEFEELPSLLGLALGPGRRGWGVGGGSMFGSPPHEDRPTDSTAFSSPAHPPGSSVARRLRRRSASFACESESRPTHQGSCCPTRAWCPPRTAPPLSCVREERASLGQCPGTQRPGLQLNPGSRLPAPSPS